MTKRFRLASYYACALAWPEPLISSEKLADETVTNASQVRRDLSHIGSFGRRGIGYKTSVLAEGLKAELEKTDQEDLIIWMIRNHKSIAATINALDPDGSVQQQLKAECEDGV